MSMFTSTDTNGYLNDYLAQEARARRQRALDRASYDAQIRDINRAGTQGVMDINQKYARGMEPQVTQYTGRGLGRSGIFQRAMKDYVQAQQRDLGDIYQGIQGKLGELNLGEQASGVALQDELDRIARQKQQEILNAAVELRSWAPYASLYSGS